MAKQRTLFRILACVCFSLIFCTCYDKDAGSIRKSTLSIMETDKAFSDMSRQQGMKKAFMEYIDNDGILLRPKHYPIVGAEAIDYLSQVKDTAFTLTWQPSNVEVASSNDLGFSYGIYTLKMTDTTISGTYVSIWKKQKDGSWKFVLDAGNDGLGK